MEYDIESILEKYEDDYNPGPRPMAQEPRNMYKYAGIVKQGPNTGKHKYTDFYPKKLMVVCMNGLILKKK